jgi:hypothetical protein
MSSVSAIRRRAASVREETSTGPSRLPSATRARKMSAESKQLAVHQMGRTYKTACTLQTRFEAIAASSQGACEPPAHERSTRIERTIRVSEIRGRCSRSTRESLLQRGAFLSLFPVLSSIFGPRTCPCLLGRSCAPSSIALPLLITSWHLLCLYKLELELRQGDRRPCSSASRRA